MESVLRRGKTRRWGPCPAGTLPIGIGFQAQPPVSAGNYRESLLIWHVVLLAGPDRLILSAFGRMAGAEKSAL